MVMSIMGLSLVIVSMAISSVMFDNKIIFLRNNKQWYYVAAPEGIELVNKQIG